MLIKHKGRGAKGFRVHPKSLSPEGSQGGHSEATKIAKPLGE